MSSLLKGIAVGFSIAAPLGPIGVLCIRRSLAEGSLMGLLTGLGAATAQWCPDLRGRACWLTEILAKQRSDLSCLAAVKKARNEIKPNVRELRAVAQVK